MATPFAISFSTNVLAFAGRSSIKMISVGGSFDEESPSPPVDIGPPPQPEMNPRVKRSNALANVWIKSFVVVAP